MCPQVPSIPACSRTRPRTPWHDDHAAVTRVPRFVRFTFIGAGPQPLLSDMLAPDMSTNSVCRPAAGVISVTLEDTTYRPL
jgi:hypothetical protein